MSEGFIADSSVGVAWAVHSQASAATDELLDRVAAEGVLRFHLDTGGLQLFHVYRFDLAAARPVEHHRTCTPARARSQNASQNVPPISPDQ